MRSKVKVTSREEILRNFTREFLIEEKKRCEIDRYITDFRILIHNMPHENHNYLNRLLQDYTSMFLSHERISVNKSNEGEMKHHLKKQLASKMKESPKKRYVKSKLSSKTSDGSEPQSYSVLKAKTEEFLQKLRNYEELEQIAYEIFIKHSKNAFTTNITNKFTQKRSGVSSEEPILKLKTREVPVEIPYKKNYKHVYVVNSPETKHARIKTADNLLMNYEYIKNETSKFLQNNQDYNDAEQKMLSEQYENNVYIKKYVDNLNSYNEDNKRSVTPKKGLLYKIKNMMGFSPENSVKSHKNKTEEILLFKEETKAFLKNEKKYNNFEFGAYNLFHEKNTEFKNPLIIDHKSSADSLHIKKDIPLQKSPDKKKRKINVKNLDHPKNSINTVEKKFENKEVDNFNMVKSSSYKNSEVIENIEFTFNPSRKKTGKVHLSENKSSVLGPETNELLITDEINQKNIDFYKKDAELTNEDFKILREQTREFLHQQKMYEDQQRGFYLIFLKEHSPLLFKTNNKRDTLLSKIKHLFRFGKSDKSKEKLYYFRKLTDEFLNHEKYYCDLERAALSLTKSRPSHLGLENQHIKQTFNSLLIEKENETKELSPLNTNKEKKFVISPSVLHQRSRSEDLLTFKTKTNSLDNINKKSPSGHKTFSDRLKRMVGIGNRKRTKSRENILSLTDPVQYFLDHERFYYDVDFNPEYGKIYNRSVSLISQPGKKNTIKTKTRNFLSTENILYQDRNDSVNSKPPSGRRRKERKTDEDKKKRRSRTLSPAQKLVSKIKNIVHRDSKKIENEKENSKFLINETEKFILDQKHFNDLLKRETAKPFNQNSENEHRILSENPMNKGSIANKSSRMNQTARTEQKIVAEQTETIEIEEDMKSDTPKLVHPTNAAKKLIVKKLSKHKDSSQMSHPIDYKNEVSIIGNTESSKSQTDFFLHDMKKFHDLDRESTVVDKTLIFVNNKNSKPTSDIRESKINVPKTAESHHSIVTSISKNEYIPMKNISKDDMGKKIPISTESSNSKQIRESNDVQKESNIISEENSSANGLEWTIKKQTKVTTRKVISETFQKKSMTSFTIENNQSITEKAGEYSKLRQVPISTNNETSGENQTSHRFEDTSKAIQDQKNKEMLKNQTEQYIRNERISNNKTEEVNIPFIKTEKKSIIDSKTKSSNECDPNKTTKNQPEWNEGKKRNFELLQKSYPESIVPNVLDPELNDIDLLHKDQVIFKKNKSISQKMTKNEESAKQSASIPPKNQDETSKSKPELGSFMTGNTEHSFDKNNDSSLSPQKNVIKNAEYDREHKQYILRKQQTEIFLKDHKDYHDKQRDEINNFLRKAGKSEKNIWLSLNMTKEKRLIDKIKRSPSYLKTKLITGNGGTDHPLKDLSAEFLSKHQYFIHKDEMNFESIDNTLKSTIEEVSTPSKINTSQFSAPVNKTVQESPTKKDKTKKSTFSKIRSLIGGSAKQSPIEDDGGLTRKQTAEFLKHLKNYHDTEYESSSKCNIFWLSESSVSPQTVVVPQTKTPEIFTKKNNNGEHDEYKKNPVTKQKTETFLKDHKDCHNKQRNEDNNFLQKAGIPEEKILLSSNNSKNENISGKIKKCLSPSYSKKKVITGKDENNKILRNLTAEFLNNHQYLIHKEEINFKVIDNSLKTSVKEVSSISKKSTTSQFGMPVNETSQNSSTKKDKTIHSRFSKIKSLMGGENKIIPQTDEALPTKLPKNVIQEGNYTRNDEEYKQYLVTKQTTGMFLENHKDYHNKQRIEDNNFLQKAGTTEEKIWLSSNITKNKSISGKLKKFLSPSYSKKKLIAGKDENDKILRNLTAEFLNKHQYLIHEEEISFKVIDNPLKTSVEEVSSISKKSTTSQFVTPVNETGQDSSTNKDKTKHSKFSKIKSLMGGTRMQSPIEDNAKLVSKQTAEFLEHLRKYNSNEYESSSNSNIIWLSENKIIPQTVETLQTKLPKNVLQEGDHTRNDQEYKEYLVTKQKTGMFLEDHKDYHNKQRIEDNNFLQEAGIPEEKIWLSSNTTKNKSISGKIKKFLSPSYSKKKLITGKDENDKILRNLSAEFLNKHQYLIHKEEINVKVIDNPLKTSVEKIPNISKNTSSQFATPVNETAQDSSTKKDKTKLPENIIQEGTYTRNDQKYKQYLVTKQKTEMFLRDHKDYHNKQRNEDNNFLQKAGIPEEKIWLSSNITKNKSISGKIKKLLSPSYSKKKLITAKDEKDKILRNLTAEFLNKHQYLIHKEEINNKVIDNPLKTSVKEVSSISKKSTTSEFATPVNETSPDSSTKKNKTKHSRFSKIKSLMGGTRMQSPIEDNAKLVSKQTAEFLEHLRKYNSHEYESSSNSNIIWLSENKIIPQTVETLQTKLPKNVLQKGDHTRNDQEYKQYLVTKQKTGMFLEDHKDYHNKQRIEDNNFLQKAGIPEEKIWLSSNITENKSISGKIKKLFSPSYSKKKLIATKDENGKILRNLTSEFLNKLQYLIHKEEINFKVIDNPLKTSVKEVSSISKSTSIQFGMPVNENIQDSSTKKDKTKHSRFSKNKSLMSGENKIIPQTDEALPTKLPEYVIQEGNYTRNDQEYKQFLVTKQKTGMFLENHKDYHNKQRIEDNNFLQKAGIPEEKIWLSSNITKNKSISSKMKKFLSPSYSKKKLITGKDENDKILRNLTAEFLNKHQYLIHEEEISFKVIDNPLKTSVEKIPYISKNTSSQFATPVNETAQDSSTKKDKTKLPENIIQEGTYTRNDQEYKQYLITKQKTEMFLRDHKDYHNKQRNEDNNFLQKAGIPEEKIWLSSNITKNKSISDKIKKFLSPSYSKKKLITGKNENDKILRNLTAEFLIKHQYLIHKEEINFKVIDKPLKTTFEKVSILSNSASRQFTAPVNESAEECTTKKDKTKKNTFSKVKSLMGGTAKQSSMEDRKLVSKQTAEFLDDLRKYINTEYESSSKSKIFWLSESKIIPRTVEVFQTKIPKINIQDGSNERKNQEYGQYLITKQKTDTFLKDHIDYHNKQRNEDNNFLKKTGLPEKNIQLSSNIAKQKSISEKMKKLLPPRSSEKGLITCKGDTDQLLKDLTAEFLMKQQYFIHKEEMNFKVIEIPLKTTVEKVSTLSKSSTSQFAAPLIETTQESSTKKHKTKKSAFSKIKSLMGGSAKQSPIEGNAKLVSKQTTEFLDHLRKYNDIEYESSSKFNTVWLSESKIIPPIVEDTQTKIKTVIQEDSNDWKDHKNYRNNQRNEGKNSLQKTGVLDEGKSKITGNESLSKNMKKLSSPNYSEKKLITGKSNTAQLLKDLTAEFLSKHQYFIDKEEMNFTVTENPLKTTVKEVSRSKNAITQFAAPVNDTAQECPTKKDKPKKNTFSKIKSLIGGTSKQSLPEDNAKIMYKQTAEFLEHLRKYHDSEYESSSKTNISWLSGNKIIPQTVEVLQTKTPETTKQNSETCLQDHNGYQNKQTNNDNNSLQKAGIPEEKICLSSNIAESRSSSSKIEKILPSSYAKKREVSANIILKDLTAEFLSKHQYFIDREDVNFRKTDNPSTIQETTTLSKITSNQFAAPDNDSMGENSTKREKTKKNMLSKIKSLIGGSAKQSVTEGSSARLVNEQTDTFLKHLREYHNTEYESSSKSNIFWLSERKIFPVKTDDLLQKEVPRQFTEGIRDGNHDEDYGLCHLEKQQADTFLKKDQQDYHDKRKNEGSELDVVTDSRTSNNRTSIPQGTPGHTSVQKIEDINYAQTYKDNVIIGESSRTKSFVGVNAEVMVAPQQSAKEQFSDVTLSPKYFEDKKSASSNIHSVKMNTDVTPEVMSITKETAEDHLKHHEDEDESALHSFTNEHKQPRIIKKKVTFSDNQITMDNEKMYYTGEMKKLTAEFVKQHQYFIHEDEIIENNLKPKPIPRKSKIATKTIVQQKHDSRKKSSEDWEVMRKQLVLFLRDHQTYHNNERNELITFATDQIKNTKTSIKITPAKKQKPESKLMSKLKSLVGSSTESSSSEKKSIDQCELKKQTIEFLISQKCFWDLEGTAALKFKEKNQSLEKYYVQETVDKIGHKKDLINEIFPHNIVVDNLKKLEKKPGEMVNDVSTNSALQRPIENKNYNFFKRQTESFLNNHQIYHNNQMKDFIAFSINRKQQGHESRHNEDTDNQNSKPQNSSNNQKTLEMDYSTEKISDSKSSVPIEKVKSQASTDSKAIPNICEDFLNRQRYYIDSENQNWRRYVMSKPEVAILKKKSSKNNASIKKLKNNSVSSRTQLNDQSSERESQKIEYEVTLYKTKLFLENHKNYHDNQRNEYIKYIPKKNYPKEIIPSSTHERKEGVLDKIKLILPSSHGKNSYNVQRASLPAENGKKLQSEVKCTSVVAKIAESPSESPLVRTNVDEVRLKDQTASFLKDNQEYHHRQNHDFIEYFGNNHQDAGETSIPKEYNAKTKKPKKGVISKLKSLLGTGSIKKADNRQNINVIKELESSPSGNEQIAPDKLSEQLTEVTNNDVKNIENEKKSIINKIFRNPEEFRVISEKPIVSSAADIDKNDFQRMPSIDEPTIKTSEPILESVTGKNIFKKLAGSEHINISEDERRKFAREKIVTKEFLLNLKDFANENELFASQTKSKELESIGFKQEYLGDTNEHEMTKNQNKSVETFSKAPTKISPKDSVIISSHNNSRNGSAEEEQIDVNRKIPFTASAPSLDQCENLTEEEKKNISLVQRIVSPMSPTKTIFKEARHKDNNPDNRVYILSEGYTITRDVNENDNIKNMSRRKNETQMRKPEPEETSPIRIIENKILGAHISESVDGIMDVRNTTKKPLDPSVGCSDGVSDVRIPHADIQSFIDEERCQSPYSTGQDCWSNNEYSPSQRKSQGDLEVRRLYTKSYRLILLIVLVILIAIFLGRGDDDDKY